MKKILLVFMLVVSTTSTFAQHYGYHRNHGYHNHVHRNGNWVAPAIIGGIIGYSLSRQYNEPIYNYGYAPTIIMQQPMIQQPVIVHSIIQNCTPWAEVQNIDGTITRTRTCNQ